ncbi:hypothetical protein AAVH_24711 [Aphelenchoides avenae]|nr:hypothetical protein AAVH_24709 [Aphelenchus avenae]KAH7708039.1 hypothetical protein AAVH_24711 [Aphelenchus avenae]
MRPGCFRTPFGRLVCPPADQETVDYHNVEGENDEEVKANLKSGVCSRCHAAVWVNPTEVGGFGCKCPYAFPDPAPIDRAAFCAACGLDHFCECRHLQAIDKRNDKWQCGCAIE